MFRVVFIFFVYLICLLSHCNKNIPSLTFYFCFGVVFVFILEKEREQRMNEREWERGKKRNEERGTKKESENEKIRKEREEVKEGGEERKKGNKIFKE
jgi:hypothetical protein